MKQHIIIHRFLGFLLLMFMCSRINVWGYGENTSYVLEENTQYEYGKYSNYYKEFSLSGPGAVLSFEIWKESAATMGMYIFGYNSKGDETQLAYYDNSDLSNKATLKELNISSDIVKIKVRNGSGKWAGCSTLNYHTKNIKVTRATTFSTSTTSIAFDSQSINISTTKTANISFNNTTYNQQVTGSCTDSHFTVTSKDVGDTGSTTIDVKYSSSTPGTHSGTVTLNMNGKSVSFPVSGTSTAVYNFAVSATPNNSSFGSATATVDASITSSNASESKQASFTATANNGYEFMGWGTTQNATTFESIENPYKPTLSNSTPGSTTTKTLYAIFKPVFNFSATVISSDTELGTVTATVQTSKILGDPDATSASTTAIFTATPKENCTFNGWYENSDYSGTPISTNTTYSTIVENTQIGSTKNITLYAKFKKNQSLSWSNPDLDLNLIVGTTTNSSATATSGLGVIYTSSNTDAITVDDDGTLHTVGLGTSTITAIQEGNYQFNPATSISREFSVGEKKQATFTPAWEGMTTDIKVGTTTSIELTNIATDNTFTISSSSDGIISWSQSGNTLIINTLKAGTTTLTLSQEGNAILNGNQASYEITVSRYPNTFAVESESKSMNVEDTWTGVITNAGNDNTQVSYSVEGVATYDVNTNTITAIGQGATTIMLSQAANDDHDGITKLITVTVSKVTNTLGVSLPTTEMNVEGTINIAIENQNSPASILATITEQQLSSSVNNGTDVITYENGVITARNAGTAKILFTQAETTKYTGYTSNTYTITVSKMGNPITVTLDGEQRNSKNIARNTAVTLAYSSPSDAAYSVTLRDGSSNVTTLNGTNLTSGSVDGTDMWDITQPETYKYESAETSIRIKVNSIAEAEGYLYTAYLDGSNYDWNTGAGKYSFSVNREPAEIRYKVWYYNNNWGETGVNEYVTLTWKDANGTTLGTKKTDKLPYRESNAELYTVPLPSNARNFTFEASGSFHQYIKEVYVVRKTYVRPSIDKTDLGDVYTDKTATATISVDYSSTNGGNISIESNNPRFTVNPASINVANNSDNVGNPSTITITYTPDPEYLGEEEATITVSDLFYSNDIKVKATAQKYSTTISKKYEDATTVNLKVDGTITDAFAFTGTSAQKPTANSNDDFYYSISHSVNAVTTGSAHPTEVISYDPATNTITALNAGTASLTIYQKKTNLYNATSQTYNFTVRKLDNPVNIALSATTLDVDGTAMVNLTNEVSDGALSATFESIDYTNESQNREGGLLSFTGNTLTAVNAGTANVTITQEETYKYLATSATFDVTVNKLAQMLTWDNPNLETSMQKGNTLEGNTATSDAGLTPVTYTSSNTASILVDANTGILTAVEAGSNITITASQAGNYKYAPASLTRQFSVFNKQTPTFVTDGNFTETNGRIALEGTATITVTGVSNDEDFTITNMNSDIISVSRNGETITIEGLSVGTAKLTLSQVANDDYLGKTQEYTIEVYLPDDYLILTPSTEPSFNEGTYSKVKLNRTLKQGYNTLSLPFDTEVAILTGRNNSDDWVAQLALVTYNGNDGYTLYFTKITNGVITANQPYILHLGAELVNPSWTNMTVVAAQGETVSVAKNYDWSMISNYTPNFSMEGKYGVVNSTGKIQKGANGSTLNAFTAYFTCTGAANVKAVVSYLDNEGELTKIEGVDFDDSTENETIYDLQGRKVEKPGKGIYIINGKKIHK